MRCDDLQQRQPRPRVAEAVAHRAAAAARHGRLQEGDTRVVVLRRVPEHDLRSSRART